ncbi:CDP-diacylglycerol--glycerol-3-phosphate 3-phosphatidyltransferase [Dinochytrium kinnereticum]|nr:CDP-diacylglycerol--glycerol-3-phosphate 3-phosphatidyltransferase [Dinochytrium kinnereticum]
MVVFDFHRLLPDGPIFPCAADHIHPLHTPDEFYGNIKDGIRNAKRRIVLSSLYLGEGEVELVECVRNRLEKSAEAKEDLKFHILIDFLRGTRKNAHGRSSVSLLQPLASAFPDRTQISLFQFPGGTALLSKCLPNRIREVVGLMHMKVYIFDDDVIISGANLSSDYFNNRQDRYIKFQNSPELAEYLKSFTDLISSFSHKLDPSSDNFVALNPISSAGISNALKGFLKNSKWSIGDCKPSDTYVLPYFQIRRLGVADEEKIMRQLITSTDFECHKRSASLTLSSPYLNLEKDYEARLAKAKLPLTLIAASPEANGFFTAKGAARHIPMAYTARTMRLLRYMERWRRKHFDYLEYYRKGWTYHAKGVWIAMDGQWGLTAIGSSNFGLRSTRRDLEAQVLVVTNNSGLQERMKNECLALKAHSKRTTLSHLMAPSRRPSYFMRGLSRAISTFL